MTDHPDQIHCEALFKAGWKRETTWVLHRYTKEEDCTLVLSSKQSTFGQWLPYPSIGELLEALKDPFHTGKLPAWKIMALILNWLNCYKNTDPNLANALADIWLWAQTQKPKLTPEEANQIEHMRSADECSKRGNFVLGGTVVQKLEDTQPKDPPIKCIGCFWKSESDEDFCFWDRTRIRKGKMCGVKYFQRSWGRRRSHD